MTLGHRVEVTRNGILQQVDTPRSLYNNPVNIFVAGFIGSPAMNFFAATSKSGKLRLPFAEVNAPDGLGDEGDVIAGIRPEDFEDIKLAPGNHPHGVEFDAPVEVLESMGSEIYAYFGFEGGEVSSAELAELARDSGAADVPGAGSGRAVARLNPESTISEGDSARLWFDAAKLHVFSTKDGTNLAHRTASGETPSVAEAEDEAAGKHPAKPPQR